MLTLFIALFKHSSTKQSATRLSMTLLLTHFFSDARAVVTRILADQIPGCDDVPIHYDHRQLGLREAIKLTQDPKTREQNICVLRQRFLDENPGWPMKIFGMPSFLSLTSDPNEKMWCPTFCMAFLPESIVDANRQRWDTVKRVNDVVKNLQLAADEKQIKPIIDNCFSSMPIPIPLQSLQSHTDMTLIKAVQLAQELATSLLMLAKREFWVDLAEFTEEKIKTVSSIDVVKATDTLIQLAPANSVWFVQLAPPHMMP
jgi:hypothetical protein